MHTIRKALALSLAFALLAALPAMAASRSEVAGKLEEFRRYFVDFQQAPDKAIPADLLAQCHGVIIMRQYKAGFVFGAKVGHGVILMHDPFTGQWSAPAFVRSGEGSFGFQIGGQSIDAIILIMNQAGVDMLLKTRFTIGVDASAAAGPVGRDLSADVGPGTALLTYARAKGLFAGASFEGGGLINNNDFNQALYGQPISVRDIVYNRTIGVPPEAQPIIATLSEYSVRNQSGTYQQQPYNYGGQPAAPIGSIRAPQGQPDYYQAAPAVQAAPDAYAADPYAALDRGYEYAQQQPGVDQNYLNDEARRAAENARQASEAARVAAEQAEEAARRASRGY